MNKIEWLGEDCLKQILYYIEMENIMELKIVNKTETV